MRFPYLTCLSLGAVAIAISACGERSVKITRSLEDENKALRVVSQLECPEHQGSLTRVRTAADGLSCDYAGPRGAEVTLQLIRLSSGQTPEQGLAPLERQLNALMPEVAAKLAKADKDSSTAEAKAEAAADSAAEAGDRAAEAEDKAREAKERAAEAQEKVDVNMPGLHVKSHNNDASVRLPGIRVDANDKGAHLSIGGMRIDADGNKSGHVNIRSNDDSVSIRTQQDAGEVRSSKGGSGLRATYILFDEQNSPTGWRLVGYEARGPSAGPVVAAVIKSRTRHEESLMEAAKKLVTHNVGG